MEQNNSVFKESLKSNEFNFSLNKINYWKLKVKKGFSKKDFNFLITFRFLRFVFCLFYKNIFESLNSKIFGKTKKYILLTRTKGIRNFFSLEDYRFKGLESKLSKSGQVSFFVHTDHNKLNFSLTPRIYGNDILKIAEFCIYGFRLRNDADEYIWQRDLKIIEKSANILSRLIPKNTVIFFWDFNFQHCPIILAGHLKKSYLIGSLHNFTEKGTLPWLEDKWPLSKFINHEFINYKKIFSERKIFLSANQFVKKTKFILKTLPKDILLLEENFSIDNFGKKRYFSLEWLNINKDHFRDIYIKKRPDKAFTKSFLKECKNNNLTDFLLISDLNEVRDTQELLVIGTYSSYLLELAAKKILCISISDKLKNPFDNPAHELVEINKINSLSKKDIVFNPVTAKTSSYLSDLIKINNQIVVSNACINHMIFKKYVVGLIFKKMIDGR